jgi:hypothetical protein
MNQTQPSRNNLLPASLALVATTALAGCAATSATNAPPPRPAAINHVVFIKLRDPSDAAALRSDSEQRLSRIPGVRYLHVGPHLDIGRTNVDSDYSIGISVGFDTTDSYRTYLAHPEHLQLLTDWKLRCEWIRIYDVIDDTP